MRIQGLQKLTLLDYPGRTACTVFLSGCNFRCPFCHNAPLLQGDTGDAMDEDALLMFLKKRQGVLDGVAVTGGEPLLRQLPSLLEKIKALGYAVKLDTNGAFPERLEAIVQAGLADYVAMDVKNSPERYAQTIGVCEPELMPVFKSVSFLLRGTVAYEFRTTAVAELFAIGRSWCGLRSPMWRCAVYEKQYIVAMKFEWHKILTEVHTLG